MGTVSKPKYRMERSGPIANLELGTEYNVRDNAVAYGWIDTRITRPPTESKVLSIEASKLNPAFL